MLLKSPFLVFGIGAALLLTPAYGSYADAKSGDCRDIAAGQKLEDRPSFRVSVGRGSRGHEAR
ncbi:MAG: hypothetical protein DMG39_18325 [Acidobacteria bacterium]|nr:MAG: hypothetical protein DMG39_18325 [Acidobacteriota bacterium]